MVLRIEKVSDEQMVILRLSGRLQSEHLEELKAHIEGLARKVVLDLEEVKLVDSEVVCFLAACEANGVQLSQCSPYIRDWIDRERTS
jgi:anti-anti-sigma regulatory factor